MRLLTFSKLLAVGAAAVWGYKHRHRFTSAAPPQRETSSASDAAATSDIVAADLIPDPGDPVQGFDEAADLHVADLDLDALDAADAEAAQDRAIFESDLDEASMEIDTPSQTTLDAIDNASEGTGELYGVHTPPAVDRAFDEHDSYDEGQNWLEALEASATEYGAEPEHEVDVIDDADEPPHPSDNRDTPVADRGSGGPAGV